MSRLPLVSAHLGALVSLDAMDVYRAGVRAILDAVELSGRSAQPARD